MSPLFLLEKIEGCTEPIDVWSISNDHCHRCESLSHAVLLPPLFSLLADIDRALASPYPLAALSIKANF